MPTNTGSTRMRQFARRAGLHSTDRANRQVDTAGHHFEASLIDITAVARHARTLRALLSRE